MREKQETVIEEATDASVSTCDRNLRNTYFCHSSAVTLSRAFIAVIKIYGVLSTILLLLNILL